MDEATSINDAEDCIVESARSAEYFAAIPGELKLRQQWVNWKIGKIKANGRFKKVPIDPATGMGVDGDDPCNWHTFDEVVADYCAGVGDGIAFVFSADDPFIGIDLDGCRDAESGTINEVAGEIIARARCYWEVSPSETGVKGIGEAVFPEGYSNSGLLPDGTGIEVYDRRRMFALTGAVLDGHTEIGQIQGNVDDLCSRYLRRITTELIGYESEPRVGLAPDFDLGLISELTDDELISEICAAKNGAEFEHLWRGGNCDDVSGGDLLVAQRLSSYTHGDVDRIKQMMLSSPRRRKKYTEKHGQRGETFLDLVVDRAVTGTNWWWTVPSALQNLATVRHTIRLTLEKAITDKAAMYKSEVLGALSWLKANWPGEWDGLKDKLRAARISMQDLNAAMKANDTGMRTAISVDLVKVQEMLPGTPSPNLVIPRGYTITETSTAILTTNQLGQQQIELIAHAPVYITERMINNDDRLQYLKLGWYQDRKHHSLVVDRGVVMNQSKLQTLASNGLPVTSFNSGALCRYLSDFEAANRATLPVVRIASQLGWQGKNGQDGFLLGRNLILPTGEMVDTGASEDEQIGAKSFGYVQFHPGSSGERQIADAIQRRGTLDGWLLAIEPLKSFPKAKVGIYIGLVAPLLEILNAPNFVVDFAGVTTAGKTTTLKVAASSWGNPDLRSHLAYIQGWHVTKVFIERAISVLNFLPLILDDTKTVRFREMVGEVIYQVVSGKGKGRGTIEGLAQTRSQKTVLISSGEAPAREFTTDGGARMRCLEIMDSPFGEVTKENGNIVTRLESHLQKNYGHTGPAFIQWLCRNRERWPDLKQRYDQRTADYTDAATNPQAGRLAKYAAAIDMAAYILHQAVSMPWPYEDPLKDLWAEMSSGAAEAPPEIRALRAIEGWCHSNETTFFGRHEVLRPTLKAKVPISGWTGFWGPAEDSNIAFYPDKLDGILEQLKFKPHEVKAGWRSRGWIEISENDKAKRLTVKRTYKMDGKNVRTNFTVIKRDAFRQLDEILGE
jgi:uncharacterized protein (DUF927 family)